MATELEILSPTDKPALLAISDGGLLEEVRSVLLKLEYKVHVAQNHEDFTNRFAQLQYQVVVIDEGFGGQSAAENSSLTSLQQMPMLQRRHATVFLVSQSLRTLDAMQAFHQSVHAIVNRADLSSLAQIVQKAVGDNVLFLSIYRDVQARMAQGAA